MGIFLVHGGYVDSVGGSINPKSGSRDDRYILSREGSERVLVTTLFEIFSLKYLITRNSDNIHKQKTR